ncbi:MAG: OadG family protein [Candidatus Hodarchaeota archaeon]
MFSTFNIEALLNGITIGLVITVLGMGLTFLALGGIVVGTILLKNLIPRIEGRKRKPSVLEPKKQTEVYSTEELTTDQDLVAVISAAVAAYLGVDQSQFRIVSIKPQQISAWGHTAKHEQTRSRKFSRWR